MIAIERVESTDRLAYVIGLYHVETTDATGELVAGAGSLLESWRYDDGWWCVADMYVSVADDIANPLNWIKSDRQ